MHTCQSAREVFVSAGRKQHAETSGLDAKYQVAPDLSPFPDRNCAHVHQEQPLMTQKVSDVSDGTAESSSGRNRADKETWVPAVAETHCSKALHFAFTQLGCPRATARRCKALSRQPYRA
eukprot:3697489-Rhodomonas_salina.1